MKILHGTWIPEASQSFIQEGNFHLWVEAAASTSKRKKTAPNIHPLQLRQPELATFLRQELGLQSVMPNQFSKQFSSQYFLLPSANSSPFLPQSCPAT